MDFLFSLFYQIPYLPYLVGAILLLVGYQKLALNLKVRAPGGGSSLEDLAGRFLGPRFAEAKLERAVARHKKQAQYMAAGRLYEDAGRQQDAVDAYLEGQEFFAAASVLERMGRLEKAGELYLQSGDYKKAAQVFVEGGRPARAAALFQEKGNSLEAARLYGIAGTWDKAAELYAKGGYPLRAAEAYEKMGDLVKAAECHEKHFMENVSYATTYSSTAASTDQKSALLAGRLFEKAGELARAREIYIKGSFFKQAAGACLALRQFPKAAELFMRAEDPESAAGAFEQAGDLVAASNLRGEVALKKDLVPEAAAYFQAGKDYLRAAELFESVGLLAEAAGAYEAGDSFVPAGSVYIRAGLKEKAAQSYERGGEFETAAMLYEELGKGRKAAELFERSGLTFKSGEAAARAGDTERAIQLLQRVGSTDENYNLATEILARLFIDGNNAPLAVERVLKVLAGQPVSPSTIDLYYWLAVGHEASGNAREAIAVYKKILAEDFRYKDVEHRAARLETGAPPARPSAPRALSPGHPRPPTPRPDPLPAPPAAGGKTPRFVKKEECGRGPLGVVFRGEDTGDGRSVALRVLPPELLQTPGLSPAMVGDLKAAAALSHPNLVKVLGLVDLGGERAVVTEFVQGRHFGEALASGHKMTFQQVHGIARVLAQTLSFVHGKGLVHGSLQPSNIMVASGVLKLADLGLGRIAHSRNHPRSYRPPENGLDVAGDLYALAGVLYHLLTGVHPRSQAQGSALPLPSTLASGVPEAFDKLLLRGLHPRVDLRIPAADDVLQELKDMVRFG